MGIHPTALVDRHVQLDVDTDIGPYCVVNGDVRLGRGTVLHAHVVLQGPAVLGEDNQVFPFAVLGACPQVRLAPGLSGGILLGNGNVVREHVTVHGGTEGGTTRLGDDNLLMVGAHVGHDGVLGSHVTMANGVQLAGHVVVRDWVTFGGLSAVAQHVRVGESAFVAGGAMCERDIPPFVIVQGDRARVRALNVVGLRRRAVPEGSIAALTAAFRKLFLGLMSRSEALRVVSRDDPYVARLVAVLEESYPRVAPPRVTQ
ncbi:MAG: acyl-ACP--UDP-N-acetylglucosamine O-acyltransferase [Myxococcales bacterium]